MTLAQLKVFVLVARLGSVKAAAAALAVSEPAVSQALAALRQHLGDPLLVRSGSAMELTEAGRRVVGIASQMVNLANDAETAVRQSQGAPELLRVVATSTIAEAMAPSLLQAFSTRTTGVEVSLSAAATTEMAALLHERLADVALGPRLASIDPDAFDSDPLFRYRLVFLATPLHPLATSTQIKPGALTQQTWCVDAAAVDPMGEVAQVLTRLRVPPDHVKVFSSPSSALAAAGQGIGIAAAVEYLAQPSITNNSLVVLPVIDTPIQLLWHVSSLPRARVSPMVAKFRRFLGTPDAMHAMRRVDGSVPATRFRPPVHVTIWS